MGFLTLIQIPCHRVLANEIVLNLKYHIVLKQNFNINLGIGIIKKNWGNLSKNTWRCVENTNKKSSFFMIPIPKFILKKCSRPIWYFKFKTISLANT